MVKTAQSCNPVQFVSSWQSHPTCVQETEHADVKLPNYMAGTRPRAGAETNRLERTSSNNKKPIKNNPPHPRKEPRPLGSTSFDTDGRTHQNHPPPPARYPARHCHRHQRRRCRRRTPPARDRRHPASRWHRCRKATRTARRRRRRRRRPPRTTPRRRGVASRPRAAGAGPRRWGTGGPGTG